MGNTNNSPPSPHGEKPTVVVTAPIGTPASGTPMTPCENIDAQIQNLQTVINNLRSQGCSLSLPATTTAVSVSSSTSTTVVSAAAAAMGPTRE